MISCCDGHIWGFLLETLQDKRGSFGKGGGPESAQLGSAETARGFRGKTPQAPAGEILAPSRPPSEDRCNVCNFREHSFLRGQRIPLAMEGTLNAPVSRGCSGFGARPLPATWHCSGTFPWSGLWEVWLKDVTDMIET